MIYVGIDPGVKTGFAIWSKTQKQFIMVKSFKIHAAMKVAEKLFQEHGDNVVFRIEDARARKWFGKKAGRERLQGAGSIKRDSKIWDDFMSDLGARYEMVAPREGTTKLDDKSFKAMTGYMNPTNEHGRDAAMKVFGF